MNNKNFKIKRTDKCGSEFIKVPQRNSGIFKLAPQPLKIYLWLLSHADGFEFKACFMYKGIGMHHVTITSNLSVLTKYNFIKMYKDGKFTIIEIVNFDTQIVRIDNKVEKYKKEKKEEKKNENVKTDISILKEENTVENVKTDNFVFGCEATREIVEDTSEDIHYSNGINNDN